MKSKNRAANKVNRNLKELDATKASNKKDLQKVEGGSSIGSIISGGMGIGPAMPPAHSGLRTG
ncbi:MAG: hypothetical protein AB7W16_04900 [Candidatus Obscuribacterales bacterium]